MSPSPSHLVTRDPDLINFSQNGFDGRAANYGLQYSSMKIRGITGDFSPSYYDRSNGLIVYPEDFDINPIIIAAAVTPFAFIAVGLLVHRLAFELRRGYWTKLRVLAISFATGSGIFLVAGFVIGLVEEGQYAMFSHLFAMISSYLSKVSFLFTITTLVDSSSSRRLLWSIYSCLVLNVLACLATTTSDLLWCRPLSSTWSGTEFGPECLPHISTSQLAIQTALSTFTTLLTIGLSVLTLRISPRPQLPPVQLLFATILFTLSFSTIPITLTPILTPVHPEHAIFPLIATSILISCISAPSLRGAWVIWRQRELEMARLEAGIVGGKQSKEEEEIVGELEKMRRRVKELEGRIEERLREREERKGKVELVIGKDDEEAGLYS